MICAASTYPYEGPAAGGVHLVDGTGHDPGLDTLPNRCRAPAMVSCLARRR